MYKDTRFWITDPPLHRAMIDFLSAVNIPEIETPIGRMFVIGLPPGSDPTLWNCDFCSMRLLTCWGENDPFPVPMLGSNAVCLDHFNELSKPIDPKGIDHLIGEEYSEYEVRSMPLEQIAWNPEYQPRKEYGLGPWPLDICSCHFCLDQIHEWKRPMEVALGRRLGFERERNIAELS